MGWLGDNFYINDKGYYFSDKHGLLHRLVYSKIHGNIPKNCIIHHIDENKLNNSVVNLQCLTKSEHCALHHKGSMHTLESKLKMSKSHTGKTLSAETKKKLSQLRTGTVCKESTKNKISETLSKAIKCVETNKVYSSIKLAEEYTGLCGIGNVLQGYAKTAGKIHWEYV